MQAGVREAIGLPGTLRDLGLTREECAGIVPDALGDHASATNPLPPSAEICEAVLEAAF